MNTSVEQAAKAHSLNWIPELEDDDYFTKKNKEKSRLDIQEHFEAGANWKEQQGGLRWVKGSERLPDLHHSAPAKHNGIIGCLSRTDERFVQFAWYGGVNSYTIKSPNLGAIEWLDESAPPNNQQGWISVEQYLPGTENYYEVKFEDGTTDEKPFRIRYSKNILGFMTEKKVTHWRPVPNSPIQ